MTKIILASNSPRRRELLENAGFAFDVKAFDIDESFSDDIPLIEVAEYLAQKKNLAYRAHFENEIIITADTIVLANEEILGKPKDKAEAKSMLQAMSGKKHWVISGVCISNKSKTVSFSDQVEVEMTELSDEEIEYYIDKCQPYDKAGGYGIQEWIGMIGINRIVGSFYTVMGLPIHLVYQTLKKEFNISPFTD